MPRNAVASGCVDFVLPPERIAEEIARIARHSYIASKADAEDNHAGNHGPIADIVSGATGVDFTHYEASTLRRGITRRMMLHRLGGKSARRLLPAEHRSRGVAGTVAPLFHRGRWRLPRAKIDPRAVHFLAAQFAQRSSVFARRFHLVPESAHLSGARAATARAADFPLRAADATRLEQVFGNLLGNACKYAGDGCHIALRAERGEHDVTVSVSDDGIGIDPEMLPRVFDLFVQSSRTLDRIHGGLGIKLTLVQRLVKVHGGSIEARSDGLGKGAEFIVRLPIHAKAPPPAPLLPPPAERAVPRRILIVDDNTDSARSFAVLRSRRGHTTRTAFTGPDAVTAAAEFQPEVVLLDIGLAGKDGFEVARQIRALPALAGTLLIAMTGYASEECRTAGFDEHLVKPVDLDVLREWLRSHPRLTARE